MDALPFILQKLFKHQDMNHLEEHNVLHILKTYAGALYTHYISIRFENLTIGDLIMIEFVCIRIVYLSLGLDEVCNHNNLWDMPHSEVNKYVPKLWPSKRTIELEFEILSICDWNPLRFCKILCDDMDVGIPLWDNKIKVEESSVKESSIINI